MFNFVRHSAIATSAISEYVDRAAKRARHGAFDGVEQREQFRSDGEQNERVRNDQADRDQRYLAVEMVDDVLAPRFGDVAEACREAELQAHHSEARIADRDRELRPEIASRRQRYRQERKQRGEDEEKIDADPDGPADDEERLQGLSTVTVPMRHWCHRAIRSLFGAGAGTPILSGRQPLARISITFRRCWRSWRNGSVKLLRDRWPRTDKAALPLIHHGSCYYWPPRCSIVAS
jgi:hypothetical protein